MAEQWSAQDHQLMARALHLARRGMYTTDPNPRVGCVLAKDGQIVAEGWHVRAGEPHAERMAIAQLSTPIQSLDCMVTLEPCAHHGRTEPCVDALLDAGIRRVVAAMIDPNPLVSGRGLARLKDAGIVARSGLLSAEASTLNQGFINRMRHGRPYVRAKLAMSIDGKVALQHGESQWISSHASRMDAHKLRARSSAILTGIGTVLLDDPSFTVRHIKHIERQPLRVVIDRKLRMPTSARMLSLPGKTLIVTEQDLAERIAPLQAAGAEIVCLPEQDNWLAALLHCLARDYAVNELLVEAGPSLSGSLLRAGLIDELVLYIAPCILGSHAQSGFALDSLACMQDKFELVWRDIRALGSDIKIQAIPTKNLQ